MGVEGSQGARGRARGQEGVSEPSYPLRPSHAAFVELTVPLDLQSVEVQRTSGCSARVPDGPALALALAHHKHYQRRVSRPSTSMEPGKAHQHNLKHHTTNFWEGGCRSDHRRFRRSAASSWRTGAPIYASNQTRRRHQPYIPTSQLLPPGGRRARLALAQRQSPRSVFFSSARPGE